ncbi:endonuclease/exonuclease/phosphatase family protein [Streptomyces sp. NBC_01429]|uniref:endonuclease/exonuclease/phosphatase family protein n=1 Tax=Streptomyces sp. NBC_01429 TaxID=2903862 RepID=UPI002E2D5823|nr:endonuclease/exonuclease/phosphatase family protein [Streptomyces sp. NBC_01429]
MWKRVFCAGVVLGTVWSGAPAASAATTPTYNVWHWNIAGNTLHRGSTTDGLVDAAVSSIRNRNADFVSVNEMCFTQYKAFQAALVSAGWPQDTGNFSRFAETRAADSGLCGGSGAYGNAIFSKRPLATSKQYTLPSDGRAENRKMLCAPLEAEPLMKFCAVHITTSNETTDGVRNNERQINHVLATLDGFDAAGQTYIIAGDFNAQPHYGRLNGFYAPSANTVNNPSNTGSHRELDDADPDHCPGYGEWTAVGTPSVTPPCGGSAKIDQIFVRESRIVGSYSADSLGISTSCTGVSACSDHRILIGTVRVTVG